jgi:hypothetical protein
MLQVNIKHMLLCIYDQYPRTVKDNGFYDRITL